MEIRISRILSEYYDFTRKESEELIRAGRVTKNNEVVGIGDKACVDDDVRLDHSSVPLKGIFRKVSREKARSSQDVFVRFGRDEQDDRDGIRFSSPKSAELRKGRKISSGTKGANRKGKNTEAPKESYREAKRLGGIKKG